MGAGRAKTWEVQSFGIVAILYRRVSQNGDFKHKLKRKKKFQNLPKQFLNINIKSGIETNSQNILNI